jgi:RNA polymerase sigma-70 factor (ECF subfamily)
VASETLAEGRRLSQHRARQTLPPLPSAAALPATVGSAAPDEAVLARRFAAGEAAAFDEVVVAYQSRVTRLANRLLGWREGRGDAHDVDDAVQDVFLAALANARRCRGGTKGMWPWLATITVNTCRSIRRRAWVRLRFIRQALAAGSPMPDAPTNAVEADDRTRKVREAVSRLGGRDREVVVLHYLEGMRPSDVAEVLGVSRNAVEVRLHRARAKLKTELELDAEFAR